MQIVRESIALREMVDGWHRAGERVALVPTMGALHAGHLALIEAAKAAADRVVASIFVNPLQFNDPGDLARYPRQEGEDSAVIQAAGCDLLWLPTADAFYPTGFATSVHVAGISERWEGAHRPGHFDGVATVVTKLFAGARPDVAIFGEKDFQQLAVIRRLSADLGLGVEVMGHETVRDVDGLALSSRNALLTPEQRERAPRLYRMLRDLAVAIAGGAQVEAEIEEAIAKLVEAGFGPVDYVAYVDSDTLEPLPTYRAGGRLIAAVFLGDVRLIDNMSVEMATGQSR
jgi:pantoate--beta-alanine ligase